MKNKYIFVVVMLLTILLCSMGLTTLYLNVSGEKRDENDNITIVTSFYPMYIATMNVVGDAKGITLKNLSEPQTGCLHDFQLTPEDMKLLSTADIFVINGGGIESFMEEVAAAYPDLTIIDACSGLSLLQDEDEENAHAWMSVEKYRAQVAAIAEGLIDADSAHKDIYESNMQDYDQKLSDLQQEADSLKDLAPEGVIIFHEAYAYVADDYGMQVEYVMDLDEERQVSAGEVADVVSAIKDNDIRYILAEELYGRDMGDTVQRETDVQVIYIDPLNRGDYDKDSYINGMSKNIELLRKAFQ